MEEEEFYNFKIDIEDRILRLEGEVERIWSKLDNLERRLNKLEGAV